ncbi:rRNA maturation RNase YbeY [Corynebacterium tapiri]|uniref:Endoribonuclease YbeY n=1 Tax=Corynebacterium tapiri TaxID=1448266 RepID=A0A5C4U388_9CORY|nr:rRNA maturation RNase YbeY [Corynebacterium tapiri]TNL96590.1 rRNA maturation RNase YbeY [Corynebacterium tapiri]
MSIEVFNESGYDGVNEEMLVSVASFALGAMDVHPDAELTITLVDEDTIADLHVRWLDLEGPTDVMSFPMDEFSQVSSTRPDAAELGPAMLGDIVLCPSFAARQAEAAGHSLAHELALLTTHGCLHVLGYDHASSQEEREMFALQNEILADWYDELAAQGTTFHPKPSGPKAFPSAADRQDLDQQMESGSIPAVGQPKASEEQA